MFGQNIYVLIGLLVFAAVCVVLLIASWTGVKVLSFKLSQKKAETEERQRKRHPDGTVIPTAPGVCIKCGQVFPQVYHLMEGNRLCETCYRTATKP